MDVVTTFGQTPIQQTTAAEPSSSSSLGLGYNSVKGQFCPSGLSDESVLLTNKTSKDQLFADIRYLKETDELNTFLDIDASARLAGFGASLEAKYKFSRSVSMRKQAEYLGLRVNYVTDVTNLTHPKLSSDAITLCDPKYAEQFLQAFGDQYVQEVTRGGELILIVEFLVQTQSERETLVESLKVAAFQGAAQGGVEVTSKLEHLTESTSLTVRLYSSGAQISVSNWRDFAGTIDQFVKLIQASPTRGAELTQSKDPYLQAFRPAGTPMPPRMDVQVQYLNQMGLWMSALGALEAQSNLALANLDFFTDAPTAPFAGQMTAQLAKIRGAEKQLDAAASAIIASFWETPQALVSPLFESFSSPQILEKFVPLVQILVVDHNGTQAPGAGGVIVAPGSMMTAFQGTYLRHVEGLEIGYQYRAYGSNPHKCSAGGAFESCRTVEAPGEFDFQVANSGSGGWLAIRFFTSGGRKDLYSVTYDVTVDQAPSAVPSGSNGAWCGLVDRLPGMEFDLWGWTVGRIMSLRFLVSPNINTV